MQVVRVQPQHRLLVRNSGSRVFVLAAFLSACADGDASSPSATEESNWSDIVSPGNDENGVFYNIASRLHADVRTIVVVTWGQGRDSVDTRLEFTFEDDEWLESPKRGLETGSHQEVILGVPEDSHFAFRLVAEVAGEEIQSEVFNTATGAAPERMPRVEVESYDANLASDNRWMLGAVSERGSGGYGGPHWIYIIDRKGRVVWYHRPAGGEYGELNQSFWPRLSRDGTHITIDRQIRKEDGDLLFTTLDFSYQRELRLPDQLDCYDITNDGYVLYYDEDTLMEIAPDGSRRDLWTCEFARCYSNAINWDPASDTVLLSYPYVNTVVRFDRRNDELMSVWGDRGDWDFEPSGLGFEFNHWPHITAQGTLLVSTHLPGTATHLFAEYEIDESTKTLDSKWTYGQGTGDWAEERSMAMRVEGGNLLGNYGPTGVIVEITPDKEIAWRVEYGHRLLGHNILIDDLYALNRGPTAP